MYINSDTSKHVLNNILNNNKIDFKKKDLAKYKKEIQKLIKDYKNFSKKKTLSNYKYFFFLGTNKKEI